MITIEEINEQWAIDAVINPTDLANESLKTPILHSKYLNYLSGAKSAYRKAEKKYLILRGKKIRYYSGEMTQYELADEGWEQYQGVKPLKAQMDDKLKTDQDLNNLIDAQQYFMNVMQVCEQIIKCINSRGYDIKNAIDYLKFCNGNL